MVVFPNCKINLGLYILRKRNDGFHDLQTVYYPLPLCDALEMIRQSDYTAGPTLEVSGNSLQCAIEDNIVYKAWKLLKRDFGELPPVAIHLHKNIPSGAGLGGGSSDGAFALSLLNRKFSLKLDENALERYALELGSDCPFFIRNRPALAEGRGEALQPLKLDLAACHIVLVDPALHVSTASAFSMVVPRDDRPSLREIIALPIREWKSKLVNDFEEPVMRAHPEIKMVKEKLYEQGADYAAMSGSGSSVFGIFKEAPAKEISFPSHYTIHRLPPHID